MKILYITAQLPWGPGEQFVLPEMRQLAALGHEVTLCPLRPDKRFMTQLQSSDRIEAYFIPPLQWKIIGSMFIELCMKPRNVLSLIVTILKESGTLSAKLKNLMVLPKGIYMAKHLAAKDYDHIHAHWMSTPATLGYILHIMTGKRWSFTAHRHDIYQDNLTEEKVKSAAFARVISKHGREALLKRVKSGYEHKIKLIHMGVNIHHDRDWVQRSEPLNNNILRVIVPASLTEIKGHVYLIDALGLLRTCTEFDISADLYGEGEMEYRLREQVDRLSLQNVVRFNGHVSPDELLDRYRKSSGDVVVVLPSVQLSESEHEGIPVSLMEAMAHGIPVISTMTGGIPELIDETCGTIIPDKDSRALFSAILELLTENHSARMQRLHNAYRKVVDEYSIECTCRILLEYFENNGGFDS